MISCWRRGKLCQVGGEEGSSETLNSYLRLPAASPKACYHTGVCIGMASQIHICPVFRSKLADSLLIKILSDCKKKTAAIDLYPFGRASCEYKGHQQRRSYLTCVFRLSLNIKI